MWFLWIVFDLWGIRVQNLLIIDIKHRFTCGKLSYHGNTVNCKDIMSLVVDNTECHSNPIGKDWWHVFSDILNKIELIFKIIKNDDLIVLQLFDFLSLSE